MVTVDVAVAVDPRPDGCRIRVGITGGFMFWDRYRGQWFISGCGNGLKAECSDDLRSGCMIRSGYGCKFSQGTLGSL